MDFYLLLPIILIFAAALIISLRDLRYGFWLWVLSLPLAHKELFSIGGVWDLLPARLIFGGLMLAVLVRLVTWLLVAGQEQFRKKAVVFIKKDIFLVLLVSLWIVRLISLSKSSDAINESFELFLFFSGIVGVYFIFKYLISRYGRDFFLKSLWIYLGVFGATGLFAVWQYYQRICCRNTIGGVWVVPGYTPRLGSTFWDVNHFGGFLLTVIPLLFSLIFYFSQGEKVAVAERRRYLGRKSGSRKYLWQILAGIGAVFATGLLFMTQSRSAWIGLLIGVAVIGIVYFYNRIKVPVILFGVGLVACGLALFTYLSINGISLRDKVASYMHYRLDSTDTHFYLLEGASEIYFDNMVIGAGYGNFDSAFRETETSGDYFDREPRLKEMKVPPHSVWGEILAETGSIGITLYSLFIGLLIAGIIAVVSSIKNTSDKHLGIGLLGSVVSIAMAGLFYSYNLEFYWFAVFLGIGFIYTVHKDKWNLRFLVSWWYQKPILPYLIIIPPALFYIFLNLGSTTLIDWDEAIYAKVAKNIVITGEWLSLRWDNFNEYWFEKPPLYMWLTALVFKITNFNSLGARFVSAVFGFLGVILTYKFGSRLFNKLTGIMSALILLSTVRYLYYARNGMLDVTVTFFIVAALYVFYVATESDGFRLPFRFAKSRKKQMLFYILSGAMIGLGVMTKAVIGLIPFPVIFLYVLYLIFIAKEKINWKGLVMLVLSSLLVAAPWHVYSVITHGREFWKDYFLDHIIDRGLTGFGHEQPWWWFLIVIKGAVRIWLFPLVAGLLVLPFIEKRRKEFVLVTIGAVFVLVFFSISKDKLLWYIVPIYPFLAVISARFMDRALSFVNMALRRDIRFTNYKLLRSLALLSVYLTSVIYIVYERDMVYYPDFNKDKVALVKIHNETYPLENHPDRKLYYSRIEPPVLYFYSDHQVKSVTADDILRLIDEAEPDQSYDFLIPEGMYYDIRDEEDEIQAPLVLDVKGAAGDWALIKSRSKVQVLRDELAIVTPEKVALELKQYLGTITREERVRLEELQAQYGEIAQQLLNYGYPAF